MRRHLTFVAAVFAILLVAAACTSDEPAIEDGGGTEETPTEEPTGDGGGGGGGALTIDQNNFFFDPDQPEVASGDTITIDNPSPAPHTFTVDGTDIDVVNDPNTSQETTIELDPGTYEFVCRFHEAQGMVGTLTVT